jgi:hypothetical protein
MQKDFPFSPMTKKDRSDPRIQQEIKESKYKYRISSFLLVLLDTQDRRTSPLRALLLLVALVKGNGALVVAANVV